jgi:hypothetical protein
VVIGIVVVVGGVPPLLLCAPGGAAGGAVGAVGNDLATARFTAVSPLGIAGRRCHVVDAPNARIEPGGTVSRTDHAVHVWHHVIALLCALSGHRFDAAGCASRSDVL